MAFISATVFIQNEHQAEGDEKHLGLVWPQTEKSGDYFIDIYWGIYLIISLCGYIENGRSSLPNRCVVACLIPKPPLLKEDIFIIYLYGSYS